MGAEPPGERSLRSSFRVWVFVFYYYSFHSMQKKRGCAACP